MGLDRVVRWETAPPMTIDELDVCLRGYIGAAGDVLRGRHTVIVTLTGRLSNPLSETLLHPERRRMFEVALTDFEVYVTTHTADEFTGAVADGFARFVERYWQGEWVKQ